MPKKQTQRGCARKKQRKSRKTQRGGDLHKMYNYNNLVQDPQRMITTSQVPSMTMKTGGKRHSRKYYKRGGSNMAYSSFNNVASQMTSKIPDMTNMIPSTATQPVAMA
jgi:hypothetical protein